MLKYSHLIGELNGDSKLIVVTLYNSVRGGTQQKKIEIQHLKLHLQTMAGFMFVFQTHVFTAISFFM